MCVESPDVLCLEQLFVPLYSYRPLKGISFSFRFQILAPSIAGGNIGSKFTLDPSTGVLSMSSLDRETVSKYILTITAKDKGTPSLEAHCNITVIVLDVNDNAPTFTLDQYGESHSTRGNSQTPEYAFSATKPPYMSNGGFQYGSNYPASYHLTKYTATISEDVAPDSSVMSVRATDPDQGVNGKITYAIADETSWLFRVDNLTGVITTAG